MPKVNGGAVRGVPVPLPPLDEIKVLVHLLNELDSCAKGARRHVALAFDQATAIEASILAKAFRGELVPNE